MRLFVLGLIRIYQLLISPLFPPACRFYPTCSQYALVAVREHGILRGSLLAVARLARCNPWHPGGVDFVPEPAGARAAIVDASKGNAACT